MAEFNTDARKKLPAKDFAEPKKRAYPIEDKAHARNAKARALLLTSDPSCSSRPALHIDPGTAPLIAAPKFEVM
jgi:hypothetical protein